MLKYCLLLVIFSVTLLAGRYIRHSSAMTVLDTKTYLIWQDNTDVKTQERTYIDTLTYCHDLNISGYADWRVPNVNELLTISDYSRENPSINSKFSNVNTEDDVVYWSSTPIKGYDDYVWAIDFKDADDSLELNTHTNCVRCVRTNKK